MQSKLFNMNLHFKNNKLNLFFKNKFICIVMLAALVTFSIFLLHKTTARNEYAYIKAAADSLIKSDKPFRFIGASAVNLVFYDDWNLDIDKAIRTAKENNISVLRLYLDWGWSKDEDFDKIIDAASRHGIYVILVLTDCCCSSDYSSLKKYFEVHAPFCNVENRQSTDAFKRRIKKIIERRNSVNGKVYRNDSTILAWEIANELEYWHFAESDVQKWIDEIATYVKSLDKNHLLTIGINTNIFNYINGNVLYKIFNAAALDFFSFHFYPSVDMVNTGNAMLPKDEICRQIDFIARKFLSLGKPVIMGEFGFSNSMILNPGGKSGRDNMNFYNLTFEKYMNAAFSAGCSGVMFWGWGVPEEKNVPMWWSQESHSTADERFCAFLKKYKFPDK